MNDKGSSISCRHSTISIFAGDEKKVREFIPELEKLKSNVLPLLAHTALQDVRSLLRV